MLLVDFLLSVLWLSTLPWGVCSSAVVALVSLSSTTTVLVEVGGDEA